MATPLGNLYSRIDAYKRGLFDMVRNPSDALSMLGGRIVESERQAEALRQQAFNNPNRPFQVTDPQAMQQLTDMYMSGPLGFAPAGIVKPEIAAKVLPQTQVVDEAGKPKIMYHGTAQDIKEFVTGPSNASFVTPDPGFAGTFAKYGEQRATKKLAESIDQNPDEKRAFLEPIIEEAMATGKLTSVNFPEHQKMAQAGFIKNLDMYTKDYWLKEFSNRPLYDITEIVGIGKEVTDALVSKLPIGRNVLPLYVDAKNPFDYEKPTHINKVISLLSKEDPTYYSGKRKADLKRALQSGSWDDIENTDVQQAIKDLGFDSFYVKEQDVKNLGVFDPKKIKSALSDPVFEDVLSNPLLQDSTK